MIGWTSTPSNAKLQPRLFAIVALLFVLLPALAPPASAQSFGGIVIGALTCDAPNTECRQGIGTQFTVTLEDGTYLGECTIEGDPDDTSSIAACVVDFPFQVDGTVVVTENIDTVTPGYEPQENPVYWALSDTVTRPSHDVVFLNKPIGGTAAVSETSDIAIITTENGQSVTDACFILTTYGNNGCDDNGDGKITFRDVPLGTYTVHQTADLGPGRSVADFTIVVRGAKDADGWERFGANVVASQPSSGTGTGTSSGSGTRDIALITRDPVDGHLLTDGCYILLEYGNEGCDENGDGQITYVDVPVGVYTVHQTQTPSGYPTISDFLISVDGPYPDVPLGYVVRQATQQVSPGSRNVSVVFVDSRTHDKIESSICVELVGGSESACDDALVDGQIDFLDVEAGTFPMTFTDLPANWQILTGDTVTVESSQGVPSIQFVYVEVSVPGSAATGSGSSGSDGNSSSGPAVTTERTWTASVTVILCDSPGQNCVGGAGVKIDISLTSGEYMGSCTTGQSTLTPWGNWISTCAVPGMPFNADFVATQDPATIPQGYAQAQAVDTISVQNLYPGGGDQSTFYFLNTRTSSSSAGTSNSNPNASATLLMTFRGCPEGFDPAIDDYFASCTIPLDAPDASIIVWGGDGQGGMPIWQLDRQYDGAYIYNAGPMTMSVDLSGLAPVVRDTYTVSGADSVNGDVYSVDLVDGETRQVYVFYYFYP